MICLLVCTGCGWFYWIPGLLVSGLYNIVSRISDLVWFVEWVWWRLFSGGSDGLFVRFRFWMLRWFWLICCDFSVFGF